MLQNNVLSIIHRLQITSSHGACRVHIAKASKLSTSVILIPRDSQPLGLDLPVNEDWDHRPKRGLQGAGRVSQLILVQADPQVAIKSIRCDPIGKHIHNIHPLDTISSSAFYLGYKKAPDAFAVAPSTPPCLAIPSQYTAI